MTAPQDIAYRPRGRFLSNRIGAHASSEVGGFGVFRDQTPFLRHPDARRIDLRATLRDPFGETYVRRFEQRQAIDVYAIVDLSASMGFGAKHDIAADLVASLAFSANRIGDRFGLIGCDRALRQELLFPASASRPLALIDRAFAAFSPHDAIPIAIVDSSEETPPRWGLLELVDAETGARRLEVMRPALQARWIDDERRRFAEIARLANGRARPPIILRDRFDALELGRGLTAA